MFFAFIKTGFGVACVISASIKNGDGISDPPLKNLSLLSIAHTEKSL
jgi:hypothetical protein